MINTNISTNIKVQVLRGGVVIDELLNQKNIITSLKMGTSLDLGNYLQVGTGSTVPVFADTILDNYLAVSSSNSTWTDETSVLVGTDYNKESSKVYTFTIGSVVGNISELGVSDSTSGSLHTRALFKDGGGLPVTISVTALDQLVVTYVVKKTVSMIPTSGVISATIGGLPVDIDYTLRPCISSSGQAGSPASYPASTYMEQSSLRMIINSANRISVDPVTYIPTQLTSDGFNTSTVTNITLTGTGNQVEHITTAPTGSANFEWRAITFMDSFSATSDFVLFQIEFDGPNYITKVDTETVTFAITETVNQVT